MIKFVTALIATLIAGWMLAGSATSASAHGGHYPGCNCGPSTSKYYKTTHPQKFYTRYHDVSVVKNVHRTHLIVHVTKIQPIIHIHDVTRIHHHTVIHTTDAYKSVTEHLTPIVHTTSSVVNTYDCGCRP